MASRRPRRGRPGPDVLAEGDTGTYAGPQGGERVKDFFRESGDLESREFGVPQADLPGGKTHVVNPPTRQVKPGGVPERPADYHKYHGVPSDDGPYELPPGDITPGPAPMPAPMVHEAVPVYIVEEPEKHRVRRDCVATNINIPAAGAEPTRVCSENPQRVEILILNEDSNNDIRFSSDLTELITTGAQGTGPAAGGALLWHGTNSYTKLRTQGELWAVSTAAASVRMSVVEISDVNE